MSWFTARNSGAAAFVHIGDNIGFGANAEDFIKALGDAQRVELRINSSGGCCATAFAIAEDLRKRDTTAEVRGVCSSAAGIIALGARTVLAEESARFLVHAPNVAVLGNATQLRRAADGNDRIAQRWQELLVTKTRLPASQVAEWFDGADHWFTAAQARALGLVDEVRECDPSPIGAPALAPDIAADDDDPEGIALLLAAIDAVGPLKVRDKASFFRELNARFTYQIT